jgi:hypothetical protein
VSKKRRRPMGGTIGSIIVGFDQQIFRTLPPAQELVVKSKPVRGLSGQAPGLEVTFPDDIVVDAGETSGEVVRQGGESRPPDTDG